MRLRTSTWLAALSVGVLVGLVAATARARDEKANVTGTWKWSFTGQNGQTFETTLKLKQDGEKLTGTVTGRNNQEIEIKDGKVSGDEVTFTVTRERNGQTFTQKYKGKATADTIEGKIEFERNGETQMRDWKAKKEKA